MIMKKNKHINQIDKQIGEIEGRARVLSGLQLKFQLESKFEFDLVWRFN